MYKNTTRGFTLIELLVVIAIIGILASVVLTSLSGQTGKANRSAFVSEVKGNLAPFVAQCDTNTAPAPLDTSNADWGTVTHTCTSTGTHTWSVAVRNIKAFPATAVNACNLVLTDAGIFLNSGTFPAAGVGAVYDAGTTCL